MDNTAWLRQTLLGTAIIGVNGECSTIADGTGEGIVVQGDDADSGWLLTPDEIAITARS